MITMILTFIILAITILLFVSGKLRSDLVALLSLLALFVFGILDTGQTLAGFGDSTVIMIAALFVVGEGLSRTGVTTWLSHKIIDLAANSKARLLIVLMLGTALLSAFISNTGTVATLLPAVVSAAWQAGSVPSKFLMPLAVSANTGGMLTLTGTPLNIVVADTLSEAGYAPFGYFEFALIGLPLLLITVGYMVFIGQRLLPQKQGANRPIDLEEAVDEIAEDFRLDAKLFRLKVPSDSSLVGKTLDESNLGRDFGITVLRTDLIPLPDDEPLTSAERRRRIVRHNLAAIEDELPGPHTVLEAHDVILVKANPGAVRHVTEQFGLELLASEDEEDLSDMLLSHDVGVAEVLVTPRSTYIGQTIASGRFSQKYDVQVVSLRQGNKIVPRKGTKLGFGDVLLVRGAWDSIEMLRNESRNFVVVGSPDEIARQVVESSPQAIIAILALVAMVAMMVTGVVPTVMATLMAVVIMVLGRCLTMEQSYRAINWQSVILIAAMIPMSTALQVTGGAQLIADTLVDSLGAIGPLALMAGVFLLTSAFSQVISNTATTVLLAPIVLQAAEDLSLSPYPFLMTVAIAASAAFLTPIASPPNTMVMTPGGYQFNDYVKVGLPLIMIFLVVSLLLIPLIWPF